MGDEPTTREDVASILHLNGAYLIHLSYPGSEDCPADEVYTAASSLEKAKRIARADQPEWVTGGFRWRHESRGLWWLSANCIEDERGY